MTAVHKALLEWGGDKNLITHVVSHSTTSWDVPGLSHHVMYNLELPTSARAVPVNFVGCQGGTSVMFVANTIAKQDPNAVVLAIAAEVYIAAHSQLMCHCVQIRDSNTCIFIYIDSITIVKNV